MKISSVVCKGYFGNMCRWFDSGSHASEVAQMVEQYQKPLQFVTCFFESVSINMRYWIGSLPLKTYTHSHTHFRFIAQLVEHRPFKTGVPGSNPGRPT